MHGITFDIAHMLAGSLVLVSFMQLYQDRLYALLNIYALHALVLAASVAWQAFVQDAPGPEVGSANDRMRPMSDAGDAAGRPGCVAWPERPAPQAQERE